MRKIVVISGLVLTIMVIIILFFYGITYDSSDSCSPPPAPVFRLINKDIHQSHSVSVIIKNTSNSTVASESYHLAPYEDIRSVLIISDNAESRYYLSFIVDDSISSEIPVDSSYHHIPELHIDAEQKKVIYYTYLLNGDYGCNLSRMNTR